MDSATEHIVAQVRQAAHSGTALHIRGGRSKAFLSGAAAGAELDMRTLQGIVSYEPSELVVTVRAGTPLRELEQVLAERGQYLAFEPPHFAAVGQESTATCGGMVAAGLAGPARVSAGSVRDFVLGVTMVNGRGELLRFGGTVMKNVAGYDVSRALAGSWGQLGVITEVSLKVLPQASAEATLCFELDQGSALAQLHQWNARPLPINASCWVCDASAGTPRNCLFVRLRGALAAVNAASRQMLQECPGERIADAQAQADWRACRDLQLPFFLAPPAPDMGLWRLSVPARAAAFDLPWTPLVEWHGAQRWIWAPMGAAASLHQLAHDLGGHARCYRHPSGAWPDIALAPQDTPLAQLQERVRQAFDPAHIFNRPHADQSRS